ncbi:MAG: DNA-processing protein DprA [Candidatus Saccharibacteria bacterium]|nr:DNA-processing protein DprA [Candidatus Saccharibacteria bacterium]
MEYKEVEPKNSPYLARLEYLEKKPKKLFYWGEIPEFDGETEVSTRFPEEGVGRPKTVAIVGARKMTPYGEAIAYKAAAELASRGVIIVSGLAAGIDAAAHKGALSVKGRTIAFLGTEITNIYPPQNRELFSRILKSGGAVFSEYGPRDLLECRMKTDSFLKRNRLISGVADAVIVVEADIKSGSLNTAGHALSQGVPVFAVPGDLNRQMSRGCNRLFNKGVSAYLSADDVLAILFKKPKKRSVIKNLTSKRLIDNPDEEAVVKAINSGVRYNEEILLFIRSFIDSEFDASRFMAAVTTLEIKGVIRSLDNNQWVISR